MAVADSYIAPLPVFLNLQNKNILLVGGNQTALAYLNALLQNQPLAAITIVATTCLPQIQSLAAKHSNIQIINAIFSNEHLLNSHIIICTINNAQIHQSLVQFTQANNTLLYITEKPTLGNFSIGAVVQNKGVSIGISANGKSGLLASRINEYLIKNPNANGISFLSADELRDKKRKRIAKYLVSAFLLMFIGHFILSYLPTQLIATNFWQFTKTLEPSLPWVIAAGAFAQLIDGALGMGYGVTANTVLTSIGLTNPAAISASIHSAEIVASGVSGYSHFKFGNVNKKLFKALVIPGVIGAILGALLLVKIGEKYGGYVKPFIAVYTLFLGVKFIINAFTEFKPKTKFKHYSILAAVGGFFDSVGGGGWGPIVTSTLVNGGRSHRFVVGSVSLTEFFVTLSSAFAFFILMGVTHWQTVIGLMIGSSIAAPFAAKLAGKIPKKTAFILLGILIIIWSGKILLKLL
jgi:uncharacterized protein